MVMREQWSSSFATKNVSIIDKRGKKVNKLGQVIRKNFAKKISLEEKAYYIFHKCGNWISFTNISIFILLWLCSKNLWEKVSQNKLISHLSCCYIWKCVPWIRYFLWYSLMNYLNRYVGRKGLISILSFFYNILWWDKDYYEKAYTEEILRMVKWNS